MSDAVIQVENLSKTYKEGLLWGRKKIEALRDVSFEARKGEIFGLLGPNGAGKTTLIKVLLGIVRRSGGKATVLNEPAGSRAMRERIGYLPENHRIPRHLTGNTAIEYYGCLSGLSLREARARRGGLLDAVGLADWGSTPVKKYSKGMLQRLGLAQSMLHEPELIILDEPTDGVDPVGRKEIRQVLKNLAAQGTSIFLNSHLLQEVELVCDRVVILFKGQVQRIADVNDLTDTGDRIEWTLQGDLSAIQSAIARCGVENPSFKVQGELTVVATHVHDQAQQNQIVDALRHAEINIQAINQQRRSLEDAFINIIDEKQRSLDVENQEAKS